MKAGAVAGASFLFAWCTDVAATLLARRRYRKVAIKAFPPDLVFGGVPLDALIRAHAPLPVPIVRELLLQICAALQQTHDRSVMHGDVQPANILIDGDGNVRVEDSGRPMAGEYACAAQVALAMGFAGTAEYMSPEQCLGHETSIASDQYSVGLIAYELLTGFPPFVGWPVEVQWAHRRELPAWVSFARRDCPMPLAAAVMRMLAKEPNERWPALRNAMVPIAGPHCTDTTGGRAALAQLIREMPSAQPPTARPLPVTSFEIPPRPSALAVDWSQHPTLARSAPPVRMPRARSWPRRIAIAAGAAVAILAVAWFEAYTLARKPNDLSIPVSVARATAAGIVNATRR